MNELFVRLRRKPLLAFELLAATFFINLLAFASPVFVMLILGVYINAGFDGTLITLSIGMLIAMLIRLAFQQVRTLQAGELGTGRDRRLSDTVFEVLSRAKTSFM
ncbi:MAG: ABC transporter, partial [Thermodesulfobacteriota bacterium]|nr:ABC transporter [Thermodesulfobacteriota bacterium]